MLVSEARREPALICSAPLGPEFTTTTRSVVVSGDHHLLDLPDRLPVHSPAAFLELLIADH